MTKRAAEHAEYLYMKSRCDGKMVPMDDHAVIDCRVRAFVDGADWMKRAVISPCGTYRYSLTREEESPMFASKGTVLFGLNNPSKADADIDDPTVKRGWAYTLAWGYHRMVYINGNPFRATEPSAALVPPEEVLAENDTHIRFGAAEADLVICAWGTKARPELASRMMGVLWCQKPLHYLELSKDGIPKHPLYLRGDLQPTLWRRRDSQSTSSAEQK